MEIPGNAKRSKPYGQVGQLSWLRGLKFLTPISRNGSFTRRCRMALKEKTRFEVIDGPSKEGLEKSLFERNCDHCNIRRTVRFEFEGEEGYNYPQFTSNEMYVGIDGIDHLDADWRDEVWIFRGSLYYLNPSHGDCRVNGCFSTKTRKGWIEISGPIVVRRLVPFTA